jgi:ferrous iron transport protein B
MKKIMISPDQSAEPPAATPGTTLSTTSLRIVIMGNPNTGKSTLFNRLTGIRQQTANYPRVTLRHHTGHFQHRQVDVEILDLPGTYSLSPRSPEELITVNMLVGNPPATAKPDLILCVVDASNLDRNLFLVSQVLDLHRPTLVAVNMIDVAAAQGQEIDLKALSACLGVPVVGIQATKGIGLEELKTAIVDSANRLPTHEHRPFPAPWQQRFEECIADSSVSNASPNSEHERRFVAIRSMFDTDGWISAQTDLSLGKSNAQRIQHEQNQLSKSGCKLAEVESQFRYEWINQNLSKVIRETRPATSTLTDRVDRWLTHPVWGLLLALIVMIAVFQVVFRIAGPASEMIDWLNATLSQVVHSFIPEGALNSLLIDGLIGGVGGVLVFLPQIVTLFLILAVLEDSGYLARAAYLMDRYLSKLGLSGITLFPLLSSFACAIPGVMATRVIPDHKERMITILIAPLMSCSARLPVYILLISAFVPKTALLGSWFGLQGFVMMAMYLVGIVVAIGVAWVLKKTWFKTKASSFVMELPTYKMPSLTNVLRRMFDGGWAFVRDAGTLIVAATILVWALSYYPRATGLPAEMKAEREAMVAQMEALESQGDEAEIAKQRDDLQTQIDGFEPAYQLRQSFLGRAGLWIEPLVKPLGWDWRIGSAAIASFPAREVVVATMGVIFGLGADQDEGSSLLTQSLKKATWDGTDQKLFTLPVALSLMVFFALCAQCSSTLAVIRRETNSWFWPCFTFGYMTTLAYLGAFLTFQISNAIIG